MKTKIRSLIFRIWYWYISTIDRKGDVLFMNYGYSAKDKNLKLDAADEVNRYSIQLYNHVAESVDLKGKHIVEVGSGRGGGLAFVTKQFAPATALGIDLDERAASFSNRFYKIEGLSFQQGDAQKLPLNNQSYDAVINVESSHRYPDFLAFLSEVERILKPGGYFLITDFRLSQEMVNLQDALKNSAFKIVKEEIITKNVVAALDLDDARRRNLIKKLAPRILHGQALNFAGAIGSPTYKMFDKSEYVYFNYVLQK